MPEGSAGAASCPSSTREPVPDRPGPHQASCLAQDSGARVLLVLGSSFRGQLRPERKAAADALLAHDYWGPSRASRAQSPPRLRDGRLEFLKEAQHRVTQLHRIG